MSSILARSIANNFSGRYSENGSFLVRKVITLERLGPKDKVYCNALNRLLAQLSKRALPTTEEWLVQGLSDDDNYFFVAKDPEKNYPDDLVGMAMIFYQWRLEGPLMQIHTVTVDEFSRGQGIGDKLTLKLLETASNLAKKIGREIKVELTSGDKRVAARKMYEKHGFKLAARSCEEAGNDGTNFYKLTVTP